MAHFNGRRSHSRFAPKPEIQAPADWDQLLHDAVHQPGTIRRAYSAFHNYSVGNQLLAMHQFLAMGRAPEPIGSYDAWQKLGRQVRKGEHASIVLCRPITFKKRVKDADTDEEVERKIARFVYRCQWFTMSQTDGDTEPQFPDLGDWNVDRAITNRGLVRVPFAMTDGNVQGYSCGNEIAVSPLAPEPVGVACHEMGHAALHQGTDPELIVDRFELGRNLIEAEAECTRLIVLESLGIDDSANCRGYIQHWYGAGNEIPSASAKRIFAAADKILKAGYAADEDDESEESEESEALAAEAA
jgi:antirestriction protein ArdC